MQFNMHQLCTVLVGLYLFFLHYNASTSDGLSLAATALYNASGFRFGVSVAMSYDLVVATSYMSTHSYRLDDSNSGLKIIAETRGLGLAFFNKVDISLKNNYVAVMTHSILTLDSYLYLYDYNGSNNEWINSKVNNLSEIYLSVLPTVPQLAITDEYVVTISNLYTIFTRNDNSSSTNGWHIDTVLTCNQSSIDPDIYEWYNFSYHVLCINKTLADFGEYGSDTESGLPFPAAIATKGDYIVSGHDGGYIVVLKRNNTTYAWSFADMFQINGAIDFEKGISSIEIVDSESDDDDDKTYIMCGTKGGVIHIFENMANDDTWTYVTNLTNPNLNENSANLGMNIAIENDIMLIGLPGAVNQTGLVYVFKNKGSDNGIDANWTQMAKITLKDVIESSGVSINFENITNAEMQFGWALDFVNNTGIIGAPTSNSYVSGQVYVIYDVDDIPDGSDETTVAPMNTMTTMESDHEDDNGYRYDWSVGMLVYESLFLLFTVLFYL